MYSEQFYRLALRYVKGFGQVSIKKMLALSGSATNLFTQPELWLAHTGKRRKRIPLPAIDEAIRAQVEQEMKLMEQQDVQLCFCTDQNYPFRLKNCSDSPVSFFYKGSGAFNMPRSVAFVGTRDASAYGRQCTRKLLNELQDSGIVTVSGLAYGIDTETHERSLEYGLRTVAVLGSGLGTIYPSPNRPLAHRILDNGGTLVSEFDYRTPPDKLNFPKRNRIIAGITDATVVVESGKSGGSIITAHIAHSYNRDVFAVPGHITSLKSEGCHDLIYKNMAAILTNGRQLLEMMNWQTAEKNIQTSLFIELDEQEQQIFDLIRNAGTISIDRLSESLPQHKPSALAGLLLGLELKGVISCLPGKNYAPTR
jgi:DNA processing protein